MFALSANEVASVVVVIVFFLLVLGREVILHRSRIDRLEVKDEMRSVRGGRNHEDADDLTEEDEQWR